MIKIILQLIKLITLGALLTFSLVQLPMQLLAQVLCLFIAVLIVISNILDKEEEK
jgi:hypothetical protein